MIYKSLEAIQIFLADERTDERKDERTDERTDGRTEVFQEVLADLKIKLNKATLW